MKNYALKERNVPNFTDIRMGLELISGLRNTISDDKVFNDSDTIGSDMHPKANSMWET